MFKILLINVGNKNYQSTTKSLENVFRQCEWCVTYRIVCPKNVFISVSYIFWCEVISNTRWEGAHTASASVEICIISSLQQ
jgi:hypothetical protein